MKKLSSLIFGISFLFLLFSCTTPQKSYLRWVSSSPKSYQDFLQARYSCFRENQINTMGRVTNERGRRRLSNRKVVMCDAFNSCLAARGFIRNDTKEQFRNDQYQKGITSRQSFISCITTDPYGYQISIYN